MASLDIKRHLPGVEVHVVVKEGKNHNMKGGPPAGSDDGNTAGQLPAGGIRLERESNSWKTMVLLCSAAVCLDLCRQICSYAMKYFNNDHFPIPSTFLVFSTESIKLAIFAFKICLSKGSCAPTSAISFAYLVPSTLYALNNNIYFLALRFTTPPVWNILMQSRVIATALVYRFYFKKAFTNTKWLALMILTSAIIILQFSGSDSVVSNGTISWNLMIALALAAVAAVFAAIGPVFTEYLLKHDKRSFDDKQYQMYMFGTMVTGSFFILDKYSKSGEEAQIIHMTGSHALLSGLVLLWTACTVTSGIVVAFIIKKLDNIVKLYTQAVSSALTALGCALLFPLAFQFDISFLISFGLTILAIYLYEAKDPYCRNKTDVDVSS